MITISPSFRPWLLGLIAVGALALAVVVFWPRQPAPGLEAPLAQVPLVSLPAPEEPSSTPPREVAPDASRILEGASRAELLVALEQRLAAGASIGEARTLLEFLARTRPQLAIDLAMNVARETAERHDLGASVIRVWAEQDPEAAWRWATDLEHRVMTRGTPSLAALAMERLVARDPEAAVVAVDAIMPRAEGGEPAIADAAHEAVAALIAHGHGEAARRALERWMASAARDDLGNAALETAALELAQGSPAGAVEWLNSLPPSPGRTFALAATVAEWTRTEPQRALAWAEQLPGAETRVDVVQRAFGRWAERDMVAATEWLATHEEDPLTDRMIVNLVNDSTLNEKHPRAAVTWAETIADPQLRMQSLHQVVQVWARQDPVAADSYMTASPLFTPEDRTRILHSLQGLGNE